MFDLQAVGLRFSTSTLRYEILDQRYLPLKEVWVGISSPDDCVELIRCLAIRGAPLIGVAAALSLAQYAEQHRGASPERIKSEANKLKGARPTAVNLATCVDRCLNSRDYLKVAKEIFEEDVLLCKKMAAAGASLIQAGEAVLTICNAGALATVGCGTALGVIIEGYKQGKVKHVYACETRPLLQGARLTMWELMREKIPCTLITDGMAASLMKQRKVSRIFVGADRIASNGDFANKIGTYMLACLAKAHGVAFHAVAPMTTFDAATPSGNDIVIEERGAEEVLGFCGVENRFRWAPENTQVWNPSFDVTPRELLTSLVLDDRVLTTEELQNSGIRIR